MSTTFSATLAEIQSLHDKKNHDYGTVGDPFANVRASEDFGVDAWLGTIIRLNDKITRIKSFARNGNLENESLRDSLIDIAVYAAIALTLFDQREEMLGRTVDDKLMELRRQQESRIQHYPSKVAEALAHFQELSQFNGVNKWSEGTPMPAADMATDFTEAEQYGCDCECSDCTCNTAEELCICGAGGVDIDCEAHGDIRCDATYYHLGEDRKCELRANHDGAHENWHTAAIHGTPPLQWAGKPEPVRAT